MRHEKIVMVAKSISKKVLVIFFVIVKRRKQCDVKVSISKSNARSCKTYLCALDRFVFYDSYKNKVRMALSVLQDLVHET